MKVRVKETGEIINIADYARVRLDKCDSYGNPIELSFDDVEILQERSDNIDWEQRRYEIAKETVTAIMSNEDFYHQVLCEGAEHGQRQIQTNIARAAVIFADALIKELKKEK